MGKYEPRYAEGEIFVVFDKRCTFWEEWTKEYLGYEYKEVCGNTSLPIFKVGKGLEEKAIEEFKEHPEFVEDAFRRDLKLEERWDLFKKAIQYLESLRNNSELGDNEYKTKIDKTMELLNEAKEI